MSDPLTGHRLVLDTQALQSPAHAERGIGRYVAGHASALLAGGAPVDALVLNPLLPAPAALPAGFAERAPVAWNGPRVVRDAARSGPVAYHVMSPFEDARPADGLVAPHGLLGADALVVTLYDVIPYVMPDTYQRGWWARQFLRRRAGLLRTADLVLAISACTARDAIDVLGLDPARVMVIGGAASSFFRKEQPGDDAAAIVRRALPDLQRPFVLTVSGYEPRKDPETLIDAFARLPRPVRDAHQLVIACTLPPEAEAAWRGHAQRRGLAPADLVLTGYAPDEVLRALYQRAALFAFTSRYEGFGLPVLEAACCGCPAVTAGASSLPEILECPASTFPPGDADALSDLLARALEDDGLRGELGAAGDRAAERHTWHEVTRRTLTAYARLPGRPPARPRRRSLAVRVALVGPFPPARSGVADYGERIARELADGVEVDCFSEGPPDPASGGTGRRSHRFREFRGFRRFPVLALGRTFSPASYDAVVYVLGNSHHHRRTLALALRYPGVVWLHDAHLGGLHLADAGLYLPDVDPETIDFDAARARMREVVERNAGPDAPDLGDDWWRPEAYVRASLPLTQEVLRSARSAIVNTEAARALVTAAAPSGLPVTVVPLAVPDPVTAEPPIEDGPPWVVTLGVVSSVKRVDDLVRAVARTRRSVPCRLALVGDVDPPYAAELRALADGLGVSDAVVVTGFVDATEYRAWIARAALVVQLRRHSHGEGSAAISDALAAGRPVLTSVGSARELPSGLVDVVDVDIDVETLAERIERLLRDPEHRAHTAAAAWAYAADHTFAATARAVLAAALTAPSRGFGVANCQ